MPLDLRLLIGKAELTLRYRRRFLSVDALGPRMKRGADTRAEHGERRCDDKEWRRKAITNHLQGDIVAFMADLDETERRIERESSVLGCETGTLAHRAASCVTGGWRQHEREHK
jgi:hypothetical protein